MFSGTPCLSNPFAIDRTLIFIVRRNVKSQIFYTMAATRVGLRKSFPKDKIIDRHSGARVCDLTVTHADF